MNATVQTADPAKAPAHDTARSWRLASDDVHEFLLKEADLLDRRHLQDWLALFTQDCVYWMPAESPEGDPERRVSLFFDDRSILEDRIWRLDHPKMFSQNPPVRQVRVLSHPLMDAAGEGASECTTRTRFILFEHRLREQRTFGGEYEHTLRREGSGYRIARKTVRLVNCDGVLWNIGVPI
jgi:benzoate/toluate 1,2-dioxygenase beta subunit